MQMHQVEYFVAVAEELGFTAGARRLHVVQSAVSAAVRELERELGGDLFDRLGRSIRLTPAGEAFLPHARGILDGVAAGRDAVDAVQGTVRGTVVVGTLTHVGPIDVVSMLADLRQRHPGVVIKLRQTPQGTRSSLEALRAGALDMAVVAVPDGVAPGLELTPLFEEGLVFVCSRQHRLASLAAMDDLAQLAGEPFIDFPEGWGNRMLVDAVFAAAGIERSVQTEVVGFGMALDLVRRDLGVAVVAASALASEGEPGIHAVRTSLVWRMQLARPASRRPSRAEQAVADAFSRAATRRDTP